MINEKDTLLSREKVFELIFSLVEQEMDAQKAVEKVLTLVDGLYSSSLISPSIVNTAKVFVKNELPIYLSAKDLFFKKGFDLKIVSHQRGKTYTPEEITELVDSRIERVRTSIIDEAKEKASSMAVADTFENLRNR
jgi:hypothetical protein